MRERDKHALWNEMVSCFSEQAYTDTEWRNLYRRFLSSWEKCTAVIVLNKEDLIDPIRQRQSTAASTGVEKYSHLEKKESLKPKLETRRKFNKFYASTTTLQSSEQLKETLPLAIWKNATGTEVSTEDKSTLPYSSPKRKHKRRSYFSQCLLQGPDKASNAQTHNDLLEKLLYEKQKKSKEILAQKKRRLEETTPVICSSMQHKSRHSAVKVIIDVQTAHAPPKAIKLTQPESQIKDTSKMTGVENSSIVEKGGRTGSPLDSVRQSNSIDFDHNYNKTQNGNSELQPSRTHMSFMAIDMEAEELLIDDALELTKSIADQGICDIFHNDIPSELEEMYGSPDDDSEIDEGKIERSLQNLVTEMPDDVDDVFKGFNHLIKTPRIMEEDTSGVHEIPEIKTPLELEVAENNDLNYDDDDDDDDDDVLSVAASCYDFDEWDDPPLKETQQNEKKQLQEKRVEDVSISLQKLNEQPIIMESLYKTKERKPRSRPSRFSPMPVPEASSTKSLEISRSVPAKTAFLTSLTTPPDANLHRAQASAARHPAVCLPVFAPPYRMPPSSNSHENRKVPTISIAHCNSSKFDVFGIKCWKYLDNSCAEINCHHQLHGTAEVSSRLMRLEEGQLISSYNDVLDSSILFQQYFCCYADVFANRRLFECMLQMIADCRLYKQFSGPFLTYIYAAMQQCGKERDAVTCIMRHLWLPNKANQYRELTSSILNILASANWPDYMVQLVDLFKNFCFPIPNEFMNEIVQSALKKKELLQSALHLVLLRRIDGVYDEALIRVLNLIAHSGSTPPSGLASISSVVTIQPQQSYRLPPPTGICQVEQADSRNDEMTSFNSNNDVSINDMLNQF